MIITGSIHTSAGESFCAALKLTYKWLHVTWLWWIGWTKGLINWVNPSSLTQWRGGYSWVKGRSYFKLEGYKSQPQWSVWEQLHLLVALTLTSLLAFSAFFLSAVFISSAIPFILSTRQCWIGTETWCTGVRQVWARIQLYPAQLWHFRQVSWLFKASVLLPVKWE